MDRFYTNSLRVLHVVIFILVCASLIFINVRYANATDTSNNIGYFYGVNWTGVEGNFVINGSSMKSDGSGKAGDEGIPVWVTDKATFISFIKGLHYESSTTNNDRIGADYIIQTMRGNNGGAGWDHARPDDSDVADWEARVNSSTVRYINDEAYEYSMNSKAEPGGVLNGVQDAVTYLKNDKRSSIVFYNLNDNSKVYAIKRDCGNPVGDFDGLPKINEWTITTSSKVKKIDRNSGVNNPNKGYAYKGDKIHWAHNVWNTTSYSTNPDSIEYHYQNRYYDDKTGGMTNDDIGGGGSQVIPGGGKAPEFTSTYKVKAADLDHRICRATSAHKQAWNNDSWIERPTIPPTTSNACVYIPYYYNLEPDVGMRPSSGAVEYGSRITVKPIVNNLNKPGRTESVKTVWSLKRTIGSDTDPISHGSDVFKLGNNYPTNTSMNVGDSYPVGTKICYTLSVDPSAYNWKGVQSGGMKFDKQCVTVGKKPKVQIWGGDLMAGGNIQTSQSIAKVDDVNKTFGSWGEYGVFAEKETNSGKYMASGSAFVNGSSKSVCENNRLSFANVASGKKLCTDKNPPVIGNYSNITSYDVTGSFGEGITYSGSYTFAPQGLLNDTHNFGGKNITLEKSNLLTGRSIILRNTGTVTIIGDQTYDPGPYTNIDTIPQLVIIAKNIVIDDSVTRVDAWLIAKDGNIQTCKEKPTSASSCPKQLKVNGPVIAKKLYLYRTAGSNSKADLVNSAEIINLRADAYLWAYNRTQIDDRIRTTSNTDLAPRY